MPETTKQPERTPLTPDQIRSALTELPGWESRDSRLRRNYQFEDFIQAWAFMSGCALEAQALNHHPDWSNVYNRVSVALWTHDRGGITGCDVELARRFERLAGKTAVPAAKG